MGHQRRPIILPQPLTAICRCHNARMYDCPDNMFIGTYTPEDIAEARRMVATCEKIDAAAKERRKKAILEETIKDAGLIGNEPGETCNRNGCQGIIQDSIMACTCHLGHPPCSKCTGDGYNCPECGWERE